MSVKGKVIGGILGSMLGGPFGAILGVAIGHTFDHDKNKQEDREYQYRQAAGPQGHSFGLGQAQMTFFVATFSMLGKMANADGQISADERNAVIQFMSNDLRLSRQDQDFALRIFDTAAVSAESFEKFAEQFYQSFYGDPQMIEMMMDILVRIAMADGVISDKENQFIAQAAMCMRYPAGNVDYLKTKYGFRQNQEGSYSSGYSSGSSSRSDSGSLAAAYSVLGCSSSDSDETIKARYKKLIKEFHPDVIASKGLPEEFMKFATEKFDQIQKAYEAIKKVRNL
ncbi:MAG: co-chaperone DjlA [Spirochaetia bacterium]|nr:co-chaperone DjlA [Spirochaetia bacterium]